MTLALTVVAAAEIDWSSPYALYLSLGIQKPKTTVVKCPSFLAFCSSVVVPRHIPTSPPAMARALS